MVLIRDREGTSRDDPPNGQFQIIDGQRRLATCQIIFSRIYHNLTEAGENDEDVESVRQHLYHRVQGGGNRDTLLMNETDREFFHKHVVQREPISESDRLTKVSHENIKAAIDTVNDFIDSEFQRLGTNADLKVRLLQIANFFDSHVAVLRLIANDLRQAYILYRSLNARGAPLNDLDLIKNALFAETTSDPQTITLWEDAIGAFENPGSAANATDFLRHHWITRYSFVRLRNRELYSQVESGLRNREIVADDFLLQLSFDATVYEAITNSSSPFWGTQIDHRKESVKRCVELLADHVAHRQIRPLLLMCVDKFKSRPGEPFSQELENFLQAFCGWAVRGHICKAWLKLPMELAVARACEELRKLPGFTTEDVYRQISGMIPDDAEFEADLSKKPLSNKLGRMIAGAIENYMRIEEDSDQTWVHPDSLTLEHILPVRPRHGNWPIFCDESDQLNEFGNERVNLLGNMTLLNTGRNQRGSNDGFEAKKELYRSSSLVLTKQLAKLDDWTVSSLDARNQKLVEYACKVWPSGLPAEN